MFHKFKYTLIFASLGILVPIPVQLLLGREWSAIFYAPLLLLAVFWLCVWFTLKDPNNKNQSKKPYLMVFWLLPVLSVFMNAVDYAFATGMDFDMQTGILLFMGVLFTGIGNYLPKVRQNSTLGIRIPWTYSSEENWNATHRLGGKVWVAAGLLLMLCVFLPGEASSWGMLLIISTAVIIPTVYSYCFYRRQKAADAPLTPMPILPGKTAKMSLVFLVLLLVFVLGTLFTGDIQYHFGETSFTIEPSYYDELTIQYSDIQNLKYLDHSMEGTRIWGFGSLQLLLGTFESQGVQYTRYTYYDPDSAVALMTGEDIIVISGKDPAESQMLYETLMDRCGLAK